MSDNLNGYESAQARVITELLANGAFVRHYDERQTVAVVEAAEAVWAWLCTLDIEGRKSTATMTLGEFANARARALGGCRFEDCESDRSAGNSNYCRDEADRLTGTRICGHCDERHVFVTHDEDCERHRYLEDAAPAYTAVHELSLIHI